MTETNKSYLYLHIAVILFGITAILGDLIELSAFWIVWWRTILASASLLFFAGIKNILRVKDRRLLLKYFGIGVIVAAHWISFYGSIKLSNASLGVICLATTSFITSLLEPLILKKKIEWLEVTLGLAIIPGMYLIVEGSPSEYNIGIIVGVISAFLASLFAVLNKSIVHTNNAKIISFFELTSAWLILVIITPLVLGFTESSDILPPEPKDWVYLLILALLCTSLAYVLALKSLETLSAFAANLTINLEPVYGVFLGWALLNDAEELNSKFYFGTAIIVLSVFMYPLIRRIRKKAS